MYSFRMEIWPPEKRGWQFETRSFKRSEWIAIYENIWIFQSSLGFQMIGKVSEFGRFFLNIERFGNVSLILKCKIQHLQSFKIFVTGFGCNHQCNIQCLQCFSQLSKNNYLQVFYVKSNIQDSLIKLLKYDN